MCLNWTDDRREPRGMHCTTSLSLPLLAQLLAGRLRKDTLHALYILVDRIPDRFWVLRLVIATRFVRFCSFPFILPSNK